MPRRKLFFSLVLCRSLTIDVYLLMEEIHIDKKSASSLFCHRWFTEKIQAMEMRWHRKILENFNLVTAQMPDALQPLFQTKKRGYVSSRQAGSTFCCYTTWWDYRQPPNRRKINQETSNSKKERKKEKQWQKWFVCLYRCAQMVVVEGLTTIATWSKLSTTMIFQTPVSWQVIAYTA